MLFTNNDWLVDGVKQLKLKNIIQPFEYCVHLDKDELKPNFNTGAFEHTMAFTVRHPKMWRSFCANNVTTHYSDDTNYDKHGHVGFAWGARREVLDAIPLYDKALIGGADHIIAHAAAGHINHPCICKSFTADIDEVNKWSQKFYHIVNGKIGYVKGTLYHIWHGDIEKRQYLKRIQDFTPKNKQIQKKDKNGLYVTNDGKDDVYVTDYFNHREVPQDDGFVESLVMGYVTDSALMGTVLGGNPMGAIIGDMLNDSDNQSIENQIDNSSDVLSTSDTLQVDTNNIESNNFS